MFLSIKPLTKVKDVAHVETIIYIKKEYFKTTFSSILRRLPPNKTVPHLDIPGVKAKLWARPRNKSSL